MLVHELIEKLNEMHPNMEVWYKSEYGIYERIITVDAHELVKGMTICCFIAPPTVEVIKCEINLD